MAALDIFFKNSQATGIFDKETKERYERSLAHLEPLDSNKNYPISGIVGKTTSARTATLIERFVSYNQQLLEEENDTVFSPILNADIPLLKIEPLTKQAISKN
ncbi:hypothetical protein D3Z51_17630 [Clostridiaceae bacterium]|nr:hypothetical protein [Clostridiaceae bacterium]RKI09950.1 hypothetical protein D7V81_16635 [bacterium 1XD21-70]